MAKFASKKAPPAERMFFPSGSTLLDLAAGGGWHLGSVVNVVGDKSTGKTLLAIEACANFAHIHSGPAIRYAEIEARFNRSYAQSMGMPTDINYTEEVHTIEDFERDLDIWLDKQTTPNLYVLDSLDACSSEAELDREVGKGSFGQEKAKGLSTLFRKRIKKLHEKRCCLFVISQIRDNIGVTFGETKKRSGGHALDFYASQVFWLAQTKSIKKVVTKVERTIGVEVRARNKKNSLALPFRQVDFQILFNYGVADEVSMLTWLKTNYGEDLLPEAASSYPKRLDAAFKNKDRDEVDIIRNELRQAVTARWEEIEEALEPPMRKYQIA